MNEALEEQASLYALDLLEPSECTAFEAALESDPALCERVEELRELAAKFAHGAPWRQQPPELETRIRDAIRATKTVTPMPPARADSSMSWLPWALAACLALTCAFLVVDRTQTRKQLAKLEERNVFAQVQIATLASQLQTSPGATATVVWDSEKQEGVLKVTNVPPTDADKDYQLWIVDPEYKQPVDAGVFAVSNDGTIKVPFKPKEHIGQANAFAVSLEKKGGSPKAEGPMVLLGK
ncbi:MAG: anti-sigma factor [Verrucomicrobiota bacterium]|nr:anti-sigma factor [Verrucomicrobiota bacterium]